MGGQLKLVPSFILAATQVEIPADVKEQFWERFGSLTSDEDIKNKMRHNLQRMADLAERKLRTYRRLGELLKNIGDEELKELYQENTAADVDQQLRELVGNLKSQAQIPSAEDIKDQLKESYHEYKAYMTSKADKGRHIDVIGIFAIVAVSVALLGY